MVFKNRNNAIALKIENTIPDKNSLQILFLPQLGICKVEDDFIIFFGFLIFNLEIWFGNVKQLV